MTDSFHWTRRLRELAAGRPPQRVKGVDDVVSTKVARHGRTLLAGENLWLVAVVVAVAVVSAMLALNASVGGQPPHADADADAPARLVAANAPATPTPAPGPVPDCRGNTARQLVKVSLRTQTMTWCSRSRVVGSTPVTTGRVAVGDGTPLGTWQITSRETHRYLSGPGYRVFVHYWLPFFADFGFHDSGWQKFPYGDLVRYRTQGSLGCIHVPLAAMGDVFRWVRVGATVTVQA